MTCFLIAPLHEGGELGIGDASIIKALAEACGAKESQIKSKYQVFVVDSFMSFCCFNTRADIFKISYFNLS